VTSSDMALWFCEEAKRRGLTLMELCDELLWEAEVEWGVEVAVSSQESESVDTTNRVVN
jgi:hypothetical protein